MKKINKRSYEGVCRKVASLCVVSMLLNVSMAGMFLSVPIAEGAPNENEQMCEAALDIVLIMDRSGSMGYDTPTRLSQAQDAANSFVGYLGAVADQSALVSYADEATLDKGLSNVHSATQTAINALAADGSTNIGDAIDLSNQELESVRANPQAVKAAILLTDGMANKPNGPGYGEDQDDVDYAIEKAEEAANAEYKIFTIGLGSNVNSIMLQKIADLTGADYYHAPGPEDLEGIYESIRWRLCEYGSISGCKYEDTDNDGNINDEVITIPDWEIILSGHSNAMQLTDQNGCYQFSGLLPGTYAVDEGGKIGVDNFEQTYPVNGSYSNIILSEGFNLENYDFGNYLFGPYCGNGITEDNEECDDGNEIDDDSCSNECLSNIPDPYCGDGNLDSGEECDDGNNINNDGCSAICEIEIFDPYCGDGNLDTGEECDDGNNTNGDGCSAICEIECGNGILDEGEECDGDEGVGEHQICSESCELINLTYCGDGVQQEPNDEGKGGPQNDGIEECDGEAGVGENQTCLRNCVLLDSLCRVNLDTMIVMDVSGSMGYDSPTRLSGAKNAANGFVEKLGSDDKSALVSFSTSANLEKPFSNLHTATQAAINNLSALGSTNIGDGIAFANSEFSNNGALKIEILLTDGRANKPNGVGYGEDARDVAYAKEKAAEAALMGIKIFTIGLGSNINGRMLYSIADTTDGEYYYAPTADDLEEIFDDIAFDICKYGSISGCKYEDSNNDGDLTGELVVSDWEIILGGDADFAQLTDENGCYNFTGLLSGNYIVSESVVQNNGVDFIQTYPQTLSYNITLGLEENITGYDFGNYFPFCGNGILDTGEECDDGNNTNDDDCSNECLSNIPDSYCGDGNLDPGEECDDGNNTNNDGCSSTCLIEQQYPICGDGVMEGSEECDDGNNVDGDGCSSSCNIECGGGDGDDPVCGDGVQEGDEECDDGNTEDGDGCSSICETESGESINLGAIVINEIMYDSSAVTDANGEWFEVYNTTGSEIDLEGCVISDSGTDSHTIAGSLIVPVNGYAVLARNGNTEENGGVSADYVYLGFTLGNTDDEIVLTCSTVEVDRVEYNEGEGWSAGVGASIILNNLANDNNNSVNWCVSITSYGDGDLGTPGIQNDSCGGQESVCGDGVQEGSEECDDGNLEDGDGCSASCSIESNGGSDPVCGDGNLDTGEECDDGNTDDGDNCSSTCEIEDSGSISAGDIVINEIMWMGSVSVVDPYPAKSSDEWIELKNTTSSEVDLSSCYLTRTVSGVEELMLGFPEGDSLAADGLYLISNYDEANSNISIEPDLVDADVSLSNSALQINLYCGGDAWDDGISIFIDGAGDDGTPLSGDNGDIKKSMARKDISGDGSLAENWCVSLTAVNWDTGVAELGTPRAQNDCGGEQNPICGDGAKEGDEECDDGNTEDGDGCSAICEIEEESTGIAFGDVVINELMWMGSKLSPTGDEWIELKNVTGESIDLSGCQLTRISSGSEDLMITIPEGVTINSEEFYLISNYDEAGSNISIEPNLVDASVSLSNSVLQIKLYCGGDWNDGGVLIDTAGNGGAPLAGDNGDDSEEPVIPKKSMSRKAIPGNGELEENWYTALIADNWDEGATELGTPGSENSM